MFYFLRSQQSRVTGPARGWLHTSCSQYLCRRWWPWLESTPVENWIPLASGELHLCKFSPEANPPSLGFTVLTSQLLLTHHLEWCKGCFFFSPLLALCWANIWPSPFLWTINTPGLLWLLALHSFRERYQSARTELTPAPAKAIFTLPLLTTHLDLSSNISSPFPYNFFNFKKVFYLLISTDFCQHSTFSLDFSLSQFGRGLVKCMPSVSGLFTKFFYSSLQDLGWAL